MIDSVVITPRKMHGGVIWSQGSLINCNRKGPVVHEIIRCGTSPVKRARTLEAKENNTGGGGSKDRDSGRETEEQKDFVAGLKKGIMHMWEVQCSIRDPNLKG